jgi:hypothetical protein
MLVLDPPLLLSIWWLLVVVEEVVVVPHLALVEALAEFLPILDSPPLL